jgi:hypothetical protein
MKPLVKATSQDKANVLRYTPDYEIKETWMNDVYTVLVVRDHPCGFKNDDGSPVLLTWLSIRRNDRAAKPDWRDFQWIKNQLVGPENEGCELYPAESRLVDGANQFHLWVFQDTSLKFPFGFQERLVTEKKLFGETQRKFPETRKPADLEANHQKVEEYKKSIDSHNKIKQISWTDKAQH